MIALLRTIALFTLIACAVYGAVKLEGIDTRRAREFWYRWTTARFKSSGK